MDQQFHFKMIARFELPHVITCFWQKRAGVFQCWHWFLQSEIQQTYTIMQYQSQLIFYPLRHYIINLSHFQFYIQYLNQRLYSSSIILNITFVIPEKEYLFHDPAYLFFVLIYLLLFSYFFFILLFFILFLNPYYQSAVYFLFFFFFKSLLIVRYVYFLLFWGVHITGQICLLFILLFLALFFNRYYWSAMFTFYFVIFSFIFQPVLLVSYVYFLFGYCLVLFFSLYCLSDMFIFYLVIFFSVRIIGQICLLYW